MVVSLGRTLYNFNWRSEPRKREERPPRPADRLVWLNLPAGVPSHGLAELAERLVEEEGLGVLFTCPEEHVLPRGVLHQPPPPETPSEARAFLDHWQPEIGVFADGELRPALVHEARLRGLPLLMVDARLPRLPSERDGWFPGLLRSTLGEFDRIITVDSIAERAFRKAGAPGERLAVLGRMEERSAALPCTEAEREALAEATKARPIWFAAAVPEIEERAVLAAHRATMALAHRLLLVLMPAEPARAEPLADKLEAEGWTIARRSGEEEPEDDTEIYVVGDPAEMGLWYRLAPLTFLGGSLSGAGAIRSPLEPAALGSAILHGPRPGPHGAALGRLGAARAARAVASSKDLADALSDLLSPDRAARLAQSAWNVVSEGAEVTEAVIREIRRMTEGEA